MLSVVSIKNNDIVTASPLGFDPTNEVTEVGVAGRRFDEWDEGF